MTGDFTTSFKAFKKLNSTSYYRLSRTREGIFEILDLFDGPFEIIEQSIIGNVRATYKKISFLTFFQSLFVVVFYFCQEVGMRKFESLIRGGFP